MTSTTVDLSQYEGKRVLVSYNKPGAEETTELEGTVESGNQIGLLLKPKGKASVEIIEAGQIERIELAPEKPKEVKVSYLKEVNFDTVRKHLADRHGVTLTEVNSMTSEEALAYHNEIDHELADLSHLHGEKPKAAANDATATEDDDEDE